MRALRAAVATLLILVLSFCCIAYAADDIVIDVQDGYLKTGNYNIKLSGDAMPISITLVDGDVILNVLTETGDSMRLNLGPGRVALTRRANPYVSVEQSAPAAGTGTATTAAVGECSQCGRPLAVGDHSKLRCGHYVCKVGAGHGGSCQWCGDFLCDSSKSHTPCPICGKGLCTHSKDDPYRTCYYLDNPAPTPFQTTDPDGRIVYFYISPDGAFIMGNPTGEKPAIWAPGVGFVEGWDKIYNPTPSPSPLPNPCPHCNQIYHPHTSDAPDHGKLCQNAGCTVYKCQFDLLGTACTAAGSGGVHSFP